MREHETKDMTDIMKCGCLVAELSVRGACTVLCVRLDLTIVFNLLQPLSATVVPCWIHVKTPLPS